MKKNKVFRTANTIKNIICWLVVAVLVFSLVVFFASRINGATPTVFGYSMFRVSSGSMEPELLVGDVILAKTVDDKNGIKIGDVVTFESEELGNILVTHEVIKAPYSENGILMLQTKGVANDVADEPIRADSVREIMVCKIPFLNTVYNIFLSPWGLLIIIGLVVLIFIDEIIVIVRILTNNTKSKKDAENINDIIERLQTEKSGNEREKADKSSELTEAKGSKNENEKR